MMCYKNQKSLVSPSLDYINVIAFHWLFGDYMCIIVGFVTFNAITVRTILMLVLTLDRFLSVFAPFFYPRHEYKITISLSIVAWVVSLLFSIIALPGLLDCYAFSHTCMVVM